jgi:hypothetical protein
MDGDETPPQWRKSTFSGIGDCIECLAAKENVYIRNSNHPHGAVLVFPRSQWLAFIAAARGGQADPCIEQASLATLDEPIGVSRAAKPKAIEAH